MSTLVQSDSIANYTLYERALTEVVAAAFHLASIPQATIEEEERPEFLQAQAADCAALDALASVIDAYVAGKISLALTRLRKEQERQTPQQEPARPQPSEPSGAARERAQQEAHARLAQDHYGSEMEYHL